MSRNYHGNDRNARETRNNGGGQDVTRSLIGKNAIITDGRTSDYQHTAADLINEAKELQRHTAPASTADSTPHALLTSAEEIAYFRQKRREEMETLIQRNFRQLNNWLKYAEWEESQKDYVRARSVYERAIPNHGSKPQLWRQYAEMEMRCPPPPINKKLAAMDAEANPMGIATTNVGGANTTTTTATAVPNSDVLAMLGVTNAATASSSSYKPSGSSVTFARSNNTTATGSTATSGAGGVSSTALMLLPTGDAAANATALQSLAAIVATPTVQPSERISQLEQTIARGGPNAMIARVRTVFDRALSSLPQCDDLWMKYIVFETTIASKAEDDAVVRSLFKRWLQYVDLPHVYELSVEFELDLAQGRGNALAKAEHVDGLLKALVKNHNNLTSWLYFADVVERRLGSGAGADNDGVVDRAASILKAAAVALGRFGKFAHNGALYQVLGRLYGAHGRWASEGRAAVHGAIVEARAIEEEQQANNESPTSSSTSSSSVVSDTLFLAYTALERQYGAHDAAALDKLTILNQKLSYHGAVARNSAANAIAMAQNTNNQYTSVADTHLATAVDAPNLALALRIIGCGRDEQRLAASQRLLAGLYTSDASSSASLGTASYVVRVSEQGDDKAAATEGAAIADLASLLGGADKKAPTGAAHATATEAKSADSCDAAASEEEELATTRKALKEHLAIVKALRSANVYATAPLSNSAKDAYVNLCLGAVNLLTMKKRNTSGQQEQSSSAALQEAKEIVRTALDVLPSHSALLWITAAKLEVHGATTTAPAPAAPFAFVEKVRKIYGAAIAHLSAANGSNSSTNASADDKMHTIYDSYIGFERAFGGLSTAAATASPASPASNNAASSNTMSHQLLLSMDGTLSAAPSAASPSSSSSADTVRSLYMAALKRFPTSVPWWVAFATFELSLKEADRCFKLLEKAEGVLKMTQTRLQQSVATVATAGTTTTSAQRQQWELEARDVQSKLDQLRGSRVGLLLQSGRGEVALDIFVDAIKTSIVEYASIAVATVESSGGGANTANGTSSSSGGSAESRRREALVKLPSYQRLFTLLRTLPVLATQMFTIAANTTKKAEAETAGADNSNKPRGDDVASSSYAYVTAMYRALAVELRRIVGTKMTFTNVPLALAVVEPMLNVWRAYEGAHGTAESVAAVSCNPIKAAAPPAPTTAAATDAETVNAPAAASAAEATTATDAAPTTATAGKKRRRLADLAENY